MENENIQKRAYNHGLNLHKEDIQMSQKQIEIIGSGKKVLDVGCNDGTLSLMIKENGNEVIGLELSDSVKIAQKKGLKAVKASVYKIPFKDNTFDVVHCSEVIEHLLDTDKALGEMKRVLKKGGRLIMSTPNFASLRDRILVLSGRLQAHAYHDEHVKIFNFKRLREAVEKNGFRVKSMNGIGFAFPIPGKCLYLFWMDRIVPKTWNQRIVIEAEKIF